MHGAPQHSHANTLATVTEEHAPLSFGTVLSIPGAILYDIEADGDWTMSR
jgi:hypothetical protein